MNRSHLIFIVGPTASGKTSLAIDEAQRLGAVILSCDSLCVYRGMDVGTAKPTPDEQSRIPHFGIDLADPSEMFSVARYIDYRNRLLEEMRHRAQPVVVVGGSGFYLKSFFVNVTDQIEIPASVENEVEEIRERSGLEGLSKALRALHHPTETYPGLDWHNPRRVEKALIRCLSSGESYSGLIRAFQSLPEPLPEWDKEVRLISRSTEDLQKRNELRVRAMLRDGLVEEVKRLQSEGFEANPSASRAIGYREVLEYLKRPGPETQLAESIFIHTNQLMRKQRTWFRRQIPVHRLIER